MAYGKSAKNVTRKTRKSTKKELIKDSCSQEKKKIKKEKTDKPQESKNQTNGLSDVNVNTVSPDSKQISKNVTSLVPSKKKIDMSDGENVRGEVIDLTMINEFLQKKKIAQAIVIDDDGNTEGKLTLKVYKSEVVYVGGKYKFCVVVDLVNSKTKKSLWCNDGSVLTNVYETMSHQYSFEAFKYAAPIDMRDEPGSSTTRGKNGRTNGIFYPFKIVVFSLSVDDSIGEKKADVLFHELASNVMKTYCSANFQDLFFMIKASMPGGLPMKFKRVLKDSFEDGRDFALLRKSSFTMEKVENAKLIDYVTDKALDNIIVPALFYDELEALKDGLMQDEEYDDIKTKVKNFGR